MSAISGEFAEQILTGHYREVETCYVNMSLTSVQTSECYFSETRRAKEKGEIKHILFFFSYWT